MPNTHETLGGLFSDVADAIRGKTGGSAEIVADDFPAAIANIEIPVKAVLLSQTCADEDSLVILGDFTGYTAAVVWLYDNVTLSDQSFMVSCRCSTTEQGNTACFPLIVNNGGALSKASAYSHPFIFSEKKATIPRNPNNAKTKFLVGAKYHILVW